MTPLDRLIRRRLTLGPVTVAEYMKLVLAHPKHGYYPTRDPIGAAGDFITAPEISQMFGELIGLWCAHVWGLIGAPKRIVLIELGPGRGTLMADALRAVRKVAPGFADAAEIHLVETSPTLRDVQRERLSDAPVFWQKSLSAAPREQAIIIGNEFLDALPVHQLVRTGDGWNEREICVERDGRLGFSVGAEHSPLGDLLDPVVARAPKGSIAELSPKVRTMGRAIGKRVARYGGAALLIDYGHAVPGAGDTLQALRRHHRHMVLSEPGEADVTAHVDFAAFGAAAAHEGARIHGPVDQGLFLRRLGIVERAEKLVRDADERARIEIDTGLRRLIEPTKMGSLFKTIALGPPSIDHMPGFVP